MADRTSTITLSIADRFSQPLQNFVQGTEKAAQSTQKLAEAGRQGAAANEKLAAASGGTAKAHEHAAQAATKQTSTLTNLQRSLVVATGAAVGFGVAAKKAFEFGQEGAVIAQTTESFDGLIRKVGVTSDLLGDLRVASGGTISDLKLMSATTTLLAGAQGDLASNLAAATPQLLEIAKAANKLNPSLGDTTFLYESLATGVKRTSPLILDNLGLTIKIGQANEAYAKQLGKTVEELTAEEMKQALLNETLRAGAVLIEQAGGAADSATDSYSRWEAQTANLINQQKVLASTVLGPVVDASAKNLQGLNTANEAYKSGAINTAQYAANLLAMLSPLGIFTDELGWLNQRLETYKLELQAANPELGTAARWQTQLGGAYAETTPEIDRQALAVQAHAGYQRALAGHTYDVIGAMTRQGEVYGEAEAALRRFNIGQAQQIELETQIKLLTGELTLEELARQEAIGYLTKQLEMGRISNEQYLEALQHLASGAWSARDAINAIGEAIQALPPSGTTWDYTINTYNRTHDVQVSEPGPPSGPIGPPGPPDTPTDDGRMAAGGRFMVPAGYFNDSYRMRVDQGEEVIVRTPRQQREGTNAAAGGLTILPGAIQVVAAPGQSEEYIAELVLAKLARHYRAVVQSGAHRMGA